MVTPSYLFKPVPRSFYYEWWLTGSPKWNRAIINVISYTCAFPAITCHNVCFETVYTEALSPSPAHLNRIEPL